MFLWVMGLASGSLCSTASAGFESVQVAFQFQYLDFPGYDLPLVADFTVHALYEEVDGSFQVPSGSGPIDIVVWNLARPGRSRPRCHRTARSRRAGSPSAPAGFFLSERRFARAGDHPTRVPDRWWRNPPEPNDQRRRPGRLRMGSNQACRTNGLDTPRVGVLHTKSRRASDAARSVRVNRGRSHHLQVLPRPPMQVDDQLRRHRHAVEGSRSCGSWRGRVDGHPALPFPRTESCTGLN